MNGTHELAVPTDERRWLVIGRVGGQHWLAVAALAQLGTMRTPNSVPR